MMTKMRENTAVILWVLVAAFVATIIFSWGMGGFDNSGNPTSTVVGKVNGQELDVRQYDAMIANRVNNGPQPPDDAAIRNARGAAWNDMVSLSLVEQQLRKLDLMPHAEEIRDWVTYLPPASVLSDTLLLSNGQFDTTKWIDRLLSYDAYKENIVRNARENYRNQKLYQRIYSAATVSEAVLQDEYMNKNRSAECRFVAFLARDFELDSTAITEEKMHSWFDANRQSLHHEEQRSADFVTFVAEASAEDSADAVDQVEYIQRQLDNGEAFEDLARVYSHDDSNAEKGGDLGWFEKGRMVKPFAEAAYAAEVGAVVGPVQTRFGYHIIKVNGHEERENSRGEKVDQVNAQHILIKIEVSTATYSDLRARVDAFVEECRSGAEFKATAAKYELTVKDVKKAISSRGNLTGIGRSQRAIDLLFNASAGDVIKPVFNRNSGWFVYHLTEIIPEGVDSFEDNRDEIYARVAEEERKADAAAAAQQWVSAHAAVTTLDTTMVEAPAKLVEPGNPLKINGYVKDVGRDPVFTMQLFSMHVGEISPPVNGEKGSFVIECLSIDSADSLAVKYQEEVLKLRKEGYLAAKNANYGNWKNQIEGSANIDDRRRNFNYEY